MTDWTGAGTPTTSGGVLSTAEELAQARTYLSQWREALAEAREYSYTMGKTSVQRARVDECLKMIRYWQNEIQRLLGGRPPGGRVRRIIAQDM